MAPRLPALFLGSVGLKCYMATTVQNGQADAYFTSFRKSDKLVWILECLFVSLLVCAGAFVGMCLVFRSPEAAMAYIRGADVIASPSVIDFGDCAPGQVKEVRIKLMNLANSMRTITGMKRSCSCILSQSLPMQIAGDCADDLMISVLCRKTPGSFTLEAIVYTDSHASPQIPVVFTGHVCCH